MLEKIKRLERKARELEPQQKKRNEWNRLVQAYADQFIEQLEEGKAFHASENTGQGLSDYPIPEQPRELEELLGIVAEWVDKPALNPASGGHLAYIPGGGIFPTALGDFLADITNNYAGIFFAGPGAVRMENLLIRWMCSLIGYPDSSLGNLTSGGSIANLIAIATARDRHGIVPERIPTAVIYLTEQAHHSVQKAIRIAGLGSCVHRYIPVDSRFRMDPARLKSQIKEDQKEGLQPFLIVGSAGTTDTGAVDPLNDLADLAETYRCWFHVDAAYGGFFVMLPECEAVFEGIDRSDSVTIDPHKGLFLAYGTGAVLIKDVEALKQTHFYKANYMQDAVEVEEEPSPADLSPELTKHFRGLRMWLPLQLFGLDRFRAALEEKIWLCRYFYDEIQKRSFEVGPYPELSVMIYRYVPETGDANNFNQALVRKVREDGRVFLSSTTIEGVIWLRLAVLSFRTHLNTIETALSSLEENVATLLEEEKETGN